MTPERDVRHAALEHLDLFCRPRREPRLKEVQTLQFFLTVTFIHRIINQRGHRSWREHHADEQQHLADLCRTSAPAKPAPWCS